MVVGAYSEKTRRRYEALVRGTGTGGRALRRPGVAVEDLPRYYRSCDIFCAPSIGSESQGIILLEAMASGRPVVASDIPGYRAVVADGVDGLLVRPRDPEALAAALRRLIADPELRERMGAAGMERAIDYSWPKIAARVIGVYEETRAAFGPRRGVRPRRRVLGRYLRRLSGLFVPLGPVAR